MIAIENTLISDDIFDKKFVCDLKACKGICCIEGESGAPLDEDELEKLDEVIDHVIPYMREDGLAEMKKTGLFEVDNDGDYVTPCVGDAECIYVNYDADGTAKCAIEQAHIDGKIEWRKPISCSLYPIRITKLKDFDALNYHQWNICEGARTCGLKADVRVFQFLKGPLTTKYGEEWYQQLEAAFEYWSQKNK